MTGSIRRVAADAPLDVIPVLVRKNSHIMVTLRRIYGRRVFVLIQQKTYCFS